MTISLRRRWTLMKGNLTYVNLGVMCIDEAGFEHLRGGRVRQ